jgi:hypothetical protein
VPRLPFGRSVAARGWYSTAAARERSDLAPA